MIERHYEQTNVLVGIEHETAKREEEKTKPKTKPMGRTKPKSLRSYEGPRDVVRIVKRKEEELVPAGAVDTTPATDE